MQLLSNLYLVGGCHFFKTKTHIADCNVYAVKAPEGVILVDCGYDEGSLHAIAGNLEYWGMSLDDVRYVLLTHSHYDHTGNARAMKERGARLVAHHTVAEALATGDERTIHYAFGRADFDTCQVDVELENKREILDLAGQSFEAINVPGHTEGNVVYLTECDGRRVMFSGDFVFHERALTADETLAWNGGTEFDTTRFIDSLLQVQQVRVDVMLPGHYGFLMAEGSTIVDNGLVVALRAWGDQYDGKRGAGRQRP